jgi:hypothetical protein
MKKGLCIALMVFLVAVAGFANPFLGTWATNVGAESGDRVVFIINEDAIVGCRYTDVVVSYSNLGTYTLTDTLITIDGVPWLYYVADTNHIGIIGWVAKDGGKTPTLIILARLGPEREDG